MNLKNIIKLSAVLSIYAINELKDGLGGWKIVSVCKQPCRLLRAQIGKNYPKCHSHFPIMGHVKE
jgi:hypothetical protein